MSTSAAIRDPIHNYIETTEIERSIIDRPEFQRLRFIRQNSTASLTYPGNATSRFVHSLGVMHVAGRMFISAMENASAETLAEFLIAFETMINQYIEGDHSPKELEGSWVGTIGRMARFSHEPLHGPPLRFEYDGVSDGTARLIMDGQHLGVCQHDPDYLIGLLWQAARLAGLVHDIGHLPMSHVFEDAILRLVQGGPSADRAIFHAEFQYRFDQYISNYLSRDLREWATGASLKPHTHPTLTPRAS